MAAKYLAERMNFGSPRLSGAETQEPGGRYTERTSMVPDRGRGCYELAVGDAYYITLTAALVGAYAHNHPRAIRM